MSSNSDLVDPLPGYKLLPISPRARSVTLEEVNQLRHDDEQDQPPLPEAKAPPVYEHGIRLLPIQPGARMTTLEETLALIDETE